MSQVVSNSYVSSNPDYNVKVESTADGLVQYMILNPPTAIGDGRKVVASGGTAEALAATTAVKQVTITALSSNTGIVVVGGSTVVASLGTRRGTPLEARDSVTVQIDDLAKVFLDVTVNGEGVSYTYLS